MPILIFFVAHWYLSLFSQTFFHHRFAAHKMFTMSKFWEKFFYIISYVTQGSSFLSPNSYGIMHRMHHAYADTEKDPHSPKYDGNIFKMMWKTRDIYVRIFNGKFKVEDRFKKNLPNWRKFEEIAVSYPSRLAWVAAYIVFYIVFAPVWWVYLLIPLHIIMGPLHGAVINWFAHRFGKADFKMDDTSKNLMPVDIFMLGEGYHNNHHKFPSRANFGYKWYQIDPIYPIIKLFNAVGIIKLVKAKADS